jgi:hypothetical protein
VVVAVLAAGCGQDSNTGLPYEPPPDAEQLVKADEVARTYLRAAARGDAERVCAMRTRGALRELGGRAACERQPTGIEVFHHRRLSGTELAAAEVLPGDTSGRGLTARVVADYGQAVLDSSHAVAGKILEVDLRMEGGRYKVSRVGAAVFVD